MKAIVTGANGFIGSSLIRKLIAKQIDVLAIDISFANSKLPENTHIVKAEIMADDIGALTDRIQYGEYDVFYHFAWRGVNGSEKGDPIIQINNISGTVKCADAAKKLGCKKFLCAGTVAENVTKSLASLKITAPGMMYGTAKDCTHTMIEVYCKNIGLPFVWMQFSNIYGPNNKTGNLISYTVNQLAKQQEASFGPADQPYDFVFVDDLIEAVYRLGIMDTSRNFYFIGSGKPRILKEYLLEIGEKCEKSELVKIGQRPDDGVKYETSMFDTAPLVQDIGEYVSFPFEKGIELTIAALKS